MSTDKVQPCPICGLPFAESILDYHVNTCLDKSEGINSYGIYPLTEEEKPPSKAVQIFHATKENNFSSANVGAILSQGITMLKKYGEAKEEGGIGFGKKHIKEVIESKEFRIFEEELRKLETVTRI